MKHLLSSISIIVFCCLFSFSSFSQSWSLKGTVGGGKSRGAIAFSIGTKAYLGTGDVGGAVTSSHFWEWDQTTNVWAQKAPVGTGYWLAVGFSIGTKGYVGCGGEGQGSTGSKTFWEYDQATNTWTAKTNLVGVARQQALGFSIGTKGYVGTGTDSWECPAGSNTSYKDLWEWDQATNAWTQMADLPANSRYGATGFSIGTKGYVCSGMDQTTFFYSDFWEYDQATNTWAAKPNFPGTARSHSANFVLGTKVYVGTGVDKLNNNLADLWSWDQATNVWIQEANFGGTARFMAVGFSIGNKGYIGLGDSGPKCIDSQKVEESDFWEFTFCSVSPSIVMDGPTTICAGGSILLIASGGSNYTYSWSNGATTASILVTPNITTTYIVTADSLGAGCSGTASITITVLPCTGMSNINSASQQVAISPNPFQYYTTVNVLGEVSMSESKEIKIFDVLGHEVRSMDFSDQSIKLERGDLTKGVYFYKVIFKNNSSSTGKFIISN